MTKTNLNATKRALLTSVMALFLCFTMLLGTTYAWFTDSVTSSGNKIISGSLKVDLELLNKESGSWFSLKETNAPIFNYTFWEPGYMDVKILKVENEGSLALKWKAVFNSPNGLGEIADVIDVYLYTSDDPISYPTDRDLTGYDNIGTVREFDDVIEDYVNGVLEAGEDDYVAIALKMREDIDNTYQGKELGAFDIAILATQYTGADESDSFDNQYDKDAPYTFTVSNAEELIMVLSDVKDKAKQIIPGENGDKTYRENVNIVLENDIVIDAETEMMYTDSNGASIHFYGMKGTLDLNGHDIIVSADSLKEGKAYANAVLLFQYSNIDIVGDGSVIANNKSIPVYAWANSTVNVYGGTYITNAHERNESAIYVNNSSAVVNVYGGNFENIEYAFNAHDNCGQNTVFILHEGVSYKQFLKNGTTDVIASDINAGRIKLADGCTLSQQTVNGEIWYTVVAE